MSNEKNDQLLASEVSLTSKQTYDDILALVGPFGKYQKIMLFFVLFPAILPSGFLSLSSIFLHATPPGPYSCTVPDVDNSTYPNSSSLLLWEADRTLDKGCLLCYVNESSSFSSGTGVCNSSSAIKSSCSYGVDFNHEVYESTVVTEWDLVCEHGFQATLTSTIFTAGGICGPLLWGFLADRIGRKKGFFCCVAFQSFFAIATWCAPNYMVFCLFRFFVGMTTSSGYVIPFILTLELVGKEQRALISVCCSFCYSVGCLIFLAMAYGIRTWRYLALASSVVAAIIYCSVWWFFPESPRWLLSQGRYDELESFLRKVSAVNNRKLRPEVDLALPGMLRRIDKEDHTKKHSFLDLFRTSNLRKKTMILVLLNCCNKGVSLGLNFYSPQFNRNFIPHVSALLNTLVELPPYLFARNCFDRLGRRTSLFIGLSSGALACLSAFSISEIFGENSAANWVLLFTLLAKFCITFTYLNGKLLEDELFPTVVRGEGHSFVSVVSSTLTCAVFFVVDLGHHYRVLPLSIFGSLCLVSSFTVFFLPETAHQRLPQTLEDGELFGKDTPLREKFRFLPKRNPREEESPIEAGEKEPVKSVA